MHTATALVEQLPPLQDSLYDDVDENNAPVPSEIGLVQPAERAVPNNAARRRAALLQQRRQQALKNVPQSLRILAFPASDNTGSHLPETLSDAKVDSTSTDNDDLNHAPTGSAALRKAPPLAVYKHPPKQVNTDLWSFQKAVIDRIAILQFLHRHAEANTSVAENSGFVRQVATQLETAGFFVSHPKNALEVDIAARKDRLSHFALRLAFSQDTGSREWFIRQETLLLQLKLQDQRTRLTQGAASFVSGRVFEQRWLKRVEPVLKLLNIEYTVLTYNPTASDAATRKLWDRILAVFSHQRVTAVLRLAWWPHLGYQVKRQRCYLQDGWGFVPFTEIDAVILAAFRRLLSDSFVLLTKQHFLLQSVVFSDPQVGPLLRTISEGGYHKFTSNVTASSSQNLQLTLDNLEQLSVTSFPPCMKNLYHGFKRTRHLRHWGRLQLWLFLKACGLTLEAQLHWWRSVWLDPDKFDKEIRYNLRHAYGQEGKRADYPAFSCSKIISGNPSPGNGDFHGCPFRHFDSDPLKQFLTRHYSLTTRDVTGILAFKESHEYQLACSELFKCTHQGMEPDGVGNNPNTYFSESCRLSRNAPSSSAAAAGSQAPNRGVQLL